MTGLHYEKQIIVAMYLQDTGKLAPLASDIERYDSDIHASRETALVQIMTQMNVPTDLLTKSQILQYSNLGLGGSVQEMIRSACRYYLNTVNL